MVALIASGLSQFQLRWLLSSYRACPHFSCPGCSYRVGLIQISVILVAPNFVSPGEPVVGRHSLPPAHERRILIHVSCICHPPQARLLHTSYIHISGGSVCVLRGLRHLAPHCAGVPPGPGTTNDMCIRCVQKSGLAVTYACIMNPEFDNRDRW